MPFAEDSSSSCCCSSSSSSQFLALVRQPGAGAGAQLPRLWHDLSFHGRLLIREAYPKLWEVILTQKRAVESGSSRGCGALVAGNSGTGKTVFLAYALHRLRSLPADIRPKVVFEDLSIGAVFVLRPERSTADVYERHLIHLHPDVRPIKGDGTWSTPAASPMASR